MRAVCIPKGPNLAHRLANKTRGTRSLLLRTSRGAFKAMKRQLHFFNSHISSHSHHLRFILAEVVWIKVAYLHRSVRIILSLKCTQ